MPIYVTWDELKIDVQEKSVMRCTFDGQWTWAELLHKAACGQEMMASVAPRKVDAMIVSGAKGYTLPAGNAIAEIMRAFDLRAGNLNRVILVSDPGVFTALARTLIQTTRVSSKTLYIVSTMEEAYQLIAAPAQR